MFKFISTFIGLCFCLLSCKKDSPVLTGYGSVELVFKARYGVQPLVYGTNYDYFGLGTISFTTNEFFYSSLKLLNSSDSVLVKDVDFVSLKNTSVAKAEEGLTVLLEKIPTGEYKTLNFNIGLTPQQNKTKPADYQSTDPLGDDSRYWPGWHSYIFSKTEGTFQNGTIYNFGYHSGFDNAMRSLHFFQDISIKDSQKSRIEIQIDYKKLFDAGGTGLDITLHKNVQDSSAFMMAFIDRFQLAVTVK